MKLKQYLIEGDPVAREPELDEFHAQTMRQRVLLETRGVERDGQMEREGFSRAWLRPIAVAGALAACLVVAVVVGLRISNNDTAYVGRPFQGRQPQTAPPRQLQFATPGGTRIIWTLHQEFDL
jgi:hypothetical protein